MCTTPWRQLSAPLDIVTMTMFNAFLIKDLTTSKSGKTNKFYCTLNDIQIVEFTLKYGMRITHRNIIMPSNFGVIIYIVGKVIAR